MVNWAGLVPEISPWSWTGLVSEIPATRRNIFQHEHSSPGDWDEPFLRKQLCFRNIAPKMAQFLSCMYFHFTSLWISLTCNSKVTRVYKTATVMNDPIFFTIAVFFLEFHPDQTGWNFPYELRPQICPGNQASKVLPGNHTHMKRAFGGLSESFSQNSVMVFEWDSGYEFSHQASNTTMITLSVWLSLIPKKRLCWILLCCPKLNLKSWIYPRKSISSI